jgi:hypothetical protein
MTGACGQHLPNNASYVAAGPTVLLRLLARLAWTGPVVLVGQMVGLVLLP